MQVSPKMFTLSQGKLKELIKIENLSTNKLIYKLKVNMPQAFTIFPARGFLEPGKTNSIQITLKKNADINARLMIVSAPVVLPQEQSFDKAWKSINQSVFRNDYIQIKCVKHSILQSRGQTKTILMTESVVEEIQIQKSIYLNSQKSQSSIHSKKQVINPIAVSNRTNIGMVQTLKQISKRSKTISIQDRKLEQNSTIQEQLKKQKYQNKLLKQKLNERDKKLKYFEQVQQKKINNSLTSEQSGFKLNNLNICLLVIVCILIGFFMANKEVTINNDL